MKKMIIFTIVMVVALCGKWNTVQAETLTAGGTYAFTLPESGTLTLTMQAIPEDNDLPIWGPLGYGCSYSEEELKGWSFAVRCKGYYNVIYGGTVTYVTVNPAVSRTVTFDPQNGASTWTVSVNHGATVPEPSPPTRAGHDFAGWYKGSNLFAFSTYTVESDITLVAHWMAVATPTYVLTVNNGSGSGSYEAGTV
jgi:uncharacterized repeat protein (TIGR02543 family)